MSITISTSDYTQARGAVIDGVEFVVRPVNSSESIALTSLASEMQEVGEDTEKLSKLIKKTEDIFFNLFDKPAEAKKILGELSIDAWWEIYAKIMEESKKDV